MVLFQHSGTSSASSLCKLPSPQDVSPKEEKPFCTYSQAVPLVLSPGNRTCLPNPFLEKKFSAISKTQQTQLSLLSPLDLPAHPIPSLDIESHGVAKYGLQFVTLLP